MRNQYITLLFIFITSYVCSQNIGIGTAVPQTKLAVNGAISAFVSNAPAAASVTIPNNVSIFWLTNVAGTQSNNLNLVTPQIGQYLTIYNGDNDVATFAGNSIASGSSADFVYINNGWRINGNLGGGVTLDGAYNYGGIGNGRIINADGGAVLIQGTDGIQSIGTYASGASLSLSGAGVRMFWYPKKAAFRAGDVSGAGSTYWNDAYIGDFSVAFGSNTKATGGYSTALGLGTSAGGDVSVAMGFNTGTSAAYAIAMGSSTFASGIASTAMGGNTSASNDYSIATGYNTTASGYTSVAMGNSTTASGYYSIATGNNTIASGDYSNTMGTNTTASSDYATAMGDYSTASGKMSMSLGSNVSALSYLEMVIGSYNVLPASYNATNWASTDRLFTVANGISNGSRSNALVILKNGNVGIGNSTPSQKLVVFNGTTTGTYTTTGWVHSSDIRLKTNIAAITNALDIVTQLNGVYYDWKENREAGRQVGFLAQDVKKILPEVVTGEEGDISKGETLGISYGAIVPVLVEAIKELKEENQKLKLEVDKLKNKIGNE